VNIALPDIAKRTAFLKIYPCPRISPEKKMEVVKRRVVCMCLSLYQNFYGKWIRYIRMGHYVQQIRIAIFY